MSLRVIRNDRLNGLTRQCTDCGSEMNATGELQYDEDLDQWYVNFWCPNDEWFAPTWSNDLAPLIEELTAGLDPATLPIKVQGS